MALQEFTQEIKNFVHDILQEVHTIIPGRVVSFDPNRCEASVLPFGNFKTPGGKLLPFPQLNSVPVFTMQGSGQAASVVFPIKPDDECLVLFSEQTLDTWRTKAASKTDLKFDMSNAIALVGLFSRPNPLVKTAADKDAVIIDRGGTRIALLPNNTVEITGNVTVTGNITATGAVRGSKI